MWAWPARCYTLSEWTHSHGLIGFISYRAPCRYPDNTPRTKEAYWYRTVFESHFPQRAAAETVPGGPSVACSTAAAALWDAAWAGALGQQSAAVFLTALLQPLCLAKAWIGPATMNEMSSLVASFGSCQLFWIACSSWAASSRRHCPGFSFGAAFLSGHAHGVRTKTSPAGQEDPSGRAVAGVHDAAYQEAATASTLGSPAKKARVGAVVVPVTAASA
jgi:hypothetical protein